MSDFQQPRYALWQLVLYMLREDGGRERSGFVCTGIVSQRVRGATLHRNGTHVSEARAGLTWSPR